MCNLYEEIEKIGIVPVVVIEDENDACDLAKALIDGGLPVAEVTFRTSAAKTAINKMADEFPDMIIGAGTILTTKQADEAVEAGAKFVVSPGFNEDVVKYCIDKNIIIIPGCSTPSDIEKAISLGLEYVKFFPAEQAGGLDMINALAGPYSNIKFMPTGGINEKNIEKYLVNKKIFACGGSYMVKKELINNKQFESIKNLTEKAVFSMLNLSIEAIDANGLIIASVSNLKRAIYHYENKGIVFDYDNAEKDNGEIRVIDMLNDDGTVKLRIKGR